MRPYHPLPLLLRAADLSRSTFYYHLKAEGQPDPQEAVTARVKKIYHQHRGRYGYRRITAQLRREGLLVNHKAIQRLMQELGLRSLVRPKKYRSYRGESHVASPNVLARRFHADAPNQAWVTDVTEFNIGGEKLYLSPVLDLYNGEIVTYQTSRRPSLDMVQGMLQKAINKLQPAEKPLVHSDQGWHYQMPAYRRLMRDRDLTQSMSRKGNCLDNAAMESFFGTLKSEFFYLSKPATIDQLQHGIRSYIHYYNNDRIRMKLKGLSPVEYRTQALAA